MNAWTDILNSEQLQERYEKIAVLDMSFAKGEKDFYESRSAAELTALANQAWLCNESEGYQLARSYLVVRL